MLKPLFGMYTFTRDDAHQSHKSLSLLENDTCFCSTTFFSTSCVVFLCFFGEANVMFLVHEASSGVSMAVNVYVSDCRWKYGFFLLTKSDVL